MAGLLTPGKLGMCPDLCIGKAMLTVFASFALNYKGIPYKTEWVEYPDIEPLCKKLGAPATSKKPDGRDHFTLPVIYDPSTKTVLTDSGPIAKYLDETYPSTRKVFPAGTDAFQASFLAFAGPNLTFPALLVLLARVADALNPPSSVYFRETREAAFGKLEDTNTPKAWADLEKGLGQVKGFLDANGEGRNLSFLGEHDTFTFSDIQIAAILTWIRIMMGADSEDWKKVAGWHDGFAGTFLAQFDKYNVDGSA